MKGELEILLSEVVAKNKGS